MSWGWVMAIIAVVLVAMLVGFAMWLWRLLTNIWSEVTVLGRRAEQLAEILGTLDLTPLDGAAQIEHRPGDLDEDGDLDEGELEDDEFAPVSGIRPRSGAESSDESSAHSPDRGIG